MRWCLYKDIGMETAVSSYTSFTNCQMILPRGYLKFSMTFTEKELKEIEDVVGKWCQNRVPEHVKDKVFMDYTITRYDVLIRERRPRWNEPEAEWTKLNVAKLHFVRTRGKWEIHINDATVSPFPSHIIVFNNILLTCSPYAYTPNFS